MDFHDKFEHRILYSHVMGNEAGQSLLTYLTRGYSRFDTLGWRNVILAGRVLVNDVPAVPDKVLAEHDCVAYLPGETDEPVADMRYSIAYEDDDILVPVKSGDLCVHPTGPFYEHTLWHLLGARYGEVHFANRLDRETSGLLIATRSRRAAAVMYKLRHKIRKEYLAIVFGHFPAKTICADGYLIPDLASAVPKKKRFVYLRQPEMQEAERVSTELRLERTIGTHFSLVRAIPITGRQHQIRATLFSLGFPLVGDKLYGPDERIFLKIPDRSVTPEDVARLRMPRQALHSAMLRFPHPATGAVITLTAPIPADFLAFIAKAEHE